MATGIYWCWLTSKHIAHSKVTHIFLKVFVGISWFQISLFLSENDMTEEIIVSLALNGFEIIFTDLIIIFQNDRSHLTKYFSSLWCWNQNTTGRTRSILWLLMPWLLTLPGHQQQWYQLCRINGSLSSMRKAFNHLPNMSVEKWLIMQIYFYVSKNSAPLGLRLLMLNICF